MATNTAYADGLDVKRAEVPYFHVKDLIVDYTRNTSRACLYKTPKGDPCCFTEADVEDLVGDGPLSLLRVGQQQPIVVYMNNRKRPVVSKGFRRVFAFQLLRERGQLEEIPNSRGGRVACVKVTQPKSPQEWLDEAAANLGENTHKPLTPVDLAFAARRFAYGPDKGGEFGLGVDEAGKYVGALTSARAPITGRAVAKYLQLLTLHPSKLAKIHTGELTMAAALRKASEDGEGKATGPRAGVKHSVLRKVVESGELRQAMKGERFGPDDVVHVIEYLCGASKVCPGWLKRALATI